MITDASLGISQIRRRLGVRSFGRVVIEAAVIVVLAFGVPALAVLLVAGASLPAVARGCGRGRRVPARGGRRPAPRARGGAGGRRAPRSGGLDRLHVQASARRSGVSGFTAGQVGSAELPLLRLGEPAASRASVRVSVSYSQRPRYQ